MAKKEKKKENKEANNELLEMRELLQRKQAELENYRKQVEKRFIEVREFSTKDVILQLLPILDNFELALKSNQDHTSETIKGVELIYSQFFSVLENNGISVIKKKEFDPYYHEALMKVDSDQPENTIVEELQKGFILNDKVIRHTKVKISSGKKTEDDCKECATENCSCETIEDNNTNKLEE